MKANFVPATRTAASELDLLRGMRDAYTARVGEPPKRGALAVFTAHVALETGRLQHCWNWNLGNVKAGGTYEGFFTSYKCNEKLHDGWHWYVPESEVRGTYGGDRVGPLFTVPPGHPQTRFRAHLSLLEGLAKHVGFLWLPRYYRPRAAMQAGDPTLACRKLKEAGYFTADLEPYTRAVVSLTGGYERAIDQHDLLREPVIPAAAAPDEDEPERSPMTNYDIEERVSALVVDGMARLNAEFWEGEFFRNRDAEQREREG